MLLPLALVPAAKLVSSCTTTDLINRIDEGKVYRE